ncbi:MAG: carbohydrate kinase [Candidatus Thiodiazotropha sp. (ex Dulcina madagascariensis)]|nr:carbohydrate kinase [Candidatus Thiodiazotropha sp. (ex Dulcina madagascariensis)]
MSGNELTIFGEVLFDCFPSGENVLGGAPFNVAWHLQAFGRSPRFISRVGRDREGDAVLQAMRQWGMDTQPLQSDDLHPTGKVMISLRGGEPSYDILADAAYDFIDSGGLAEAACTTLYHGSLGLRNPVARAALERLKANRPQRIFMDVNLRDPWWQRETVLAWLSQADWVKLNEAELALLHDSHTAGLSATAAAFKQRHDLQGLVVTRGGEGALALFHDRPAIEITPEKQLDLIDTVGAGDAFSAVLLLGLTLDWPLRLTLERAQTFASAIVGQRGATVREPSFYQTFADEWQLA